MAIAKRAKKFRQKHLSDKIEQKKREKKHAQLVQSRKGKKAGKPVKSTGKPAPDFNVEKSALFDEPGNDTEPGFAKYLSDSENSDYEAEEEEYLNEDKETETETGKSEGFPELIDVKVIKRWRESLKTSPSALKFVVRAAAAESLPKIADEKALDALREVLLVDVPEMVSEKFPQPGDVKGLRPVFKSLADLLSQLLVDMGSDNEKSLVRFVSAVHRLLPHFTSFNREFRSLVTGLVAVIVRVDRDDHVKLLAFNALREVCERSSGEVQALVAKQAYASLIKVAAHTNNYSIDSLNFSKNLFASLFDISTPAEKPEVYQLAFQQVRQLALHLKTALDKVKHPDYDVKVIYTWQFVQSLDFWSRAISMSPGLHPLIHPICQVTLRVVSLVPSQQYIPLRFYLIRSLIRLGRHTGVYIPLAPPLLEAVLHSNVLSRPGKAASLQQPDFETILHVPAGYLGTTVYQNSVLEEFIDVFVEAMVLYTKSIAFPELVAPVTIALRRFVKHHSAMKQTSMKTSKSLLALCERLEANAAYISKHRRSVNFGPRDKVAADKFLVDVKWEDTPLGKEAVARQKVREERRKLIASIRNESNNKEAEDDLVNTGFGDGSDVDDDEESAEGEREEEIEEALLELEA